MASRSIIVRSSSHHGSAPAEKRVTRKRSPLNIRNIISKDDGSTFVLFVFEPQLCILLAHQECRHFRRPATVVSVLSRRTVRSPPGRCVPKGKSMNNPNTQADFFIEGEGRFCTVYLLRPLTPAAFDWIEEHILEDAQRLGNAVAVEHGYISDIVAGIQGDGLAVGR